MRKGLMLFVMGLGLASLGASCNPPTPNPTPTPSPATCECVAPTAAEDTWAPTAADTPWNSLYVSEACSAIGDQLRGDELRSALVGQLKAKNVCAASFGTMIVAARPDGSWEAWEGPSDVSCFGLKFAGAWIIPGAKACKK
jgi:hypothetical protein